MAVGEDPQVVVEMAQTLEPRGRAGESDDVGLYVCVCVCVCVCVYVCVHENMHVKYIDVHISIQ